MNTIHQFLYILLSQMVEILYLKGYETRLQMLISLIEFSNHA